MNRPVCPLEQELPRARALQTLRIFAVDTASSAMVGMRMPFAQQVACGLGFWLWRSNGETLLFWFNVEMKPCVCFCVTSWRCHPGINSFLTHCCFFPCFQDSCCCFLLVWETWAKTNVPLSQETKKNLEVLLLSAAGFGKSLTAIFVFDGACCSSVISHRVTTRNFSL